VARQRFTIVCTGTLIHGSHDPSALFEALAALVAAGDLDRDALEVWLIGRNLEVGWQALASHAGLESRVRLQPLVPREVALAAQRDATVLLILGSTESPHRGVVTGKVFEYLAAERPILAFGPRGGALDQLLAETGGGVVVTSAAEARTALLDWAREFAATGRVAWRGNAAAVAQYDRRTLAGRWAALLDRAAAGERER
jgi:glycosyltransferase involved in cell wall biosynthesis